MGTAMRLFPSYRSKLQASLFVLGLLAIAVTYWQASQGATAALRKTTYDHLTAIRETKRRAVEDYFNDLTNRVVALSTDESSIAALEQFRLAWDSLPAVTLQDPRYKALTQKYRDVPEWFPADPRTRRLQLLFLTSNSQEDLLLEPKGSGAYGKVHARYHPTFHRYLTAFGLYDIFLIDAHDGRILYTVTKEIDLGARLTKPPYQSTTLARAYQRADSAVIEDYEPYAPSHFAPAAFVAAPIRRAGSKIGVLAIQVSIDEVNRLITGDHHWEGEGMGRTGHAYIVGADRMLRSDLRFEIEQPEAFFTQLRTAGTSTEVIDRIRRNRTAILNLSIPEQTQSIGKDFRGVEVIRSHARLNLPGLDWTLVAEMETQEAFAPVSALQRRLLVTGLLVSVGFMAAAWLLGRSVTRPVMALAEGTRRLSGRDFGVRLPVESSDEIGHLAESFNRMAERLEQTTVSRDELDRANRELEALNARLITAQEEERSRLARELHDDLTQRLAAVAISAGSLKLAPERDPVRWRSELGTIQDQLAQISNDVHGLSRRLHSATLDDLGLVAAVEGECRGFFERGGPPVAFSHSGSFQSLSKDAQLGLYRIVQEALRNIFRHAEATEAAIRLNANVDEVTLEVEDNGRGFDQSSSRPGLGLSSMSERARLLSGSVTIRSQPGKGTLVSAKLPYKATS
jgi:signal transduction histidine kinase